MDSLIALAIIIITLTTCTILAAATTRRRITKQIKLTYTWAECLIYAIFLAIYKYTIITYDIQTIIRQALTLLE